MKMSEKVQNIFKFCHFFKKKLKNLKKNKKNALQFIENSVSYICV